MREISSEVVWKTLRWLCHEANYNLPHDVLASLKAARGEERAPLAKKVLDVIIHNAEIAARDRVALCQDTGTAVIFLEMGQDVRVSGDLHEALLKGVSEGYKTGFLRSSMVSQPFSKRSNTADNTPPVIHTEIVPGDRMKITLMPKGGGCENMSRLAILKPGEGRKGVIDFVVRTVEESGGNPCPPVIAGVGIGGTAEYAMYLAKRSLLRKVGEHHSDPEIASLEQELLERINATGIGPQAWGGKTTALAVNVETYPTHITSLPVGVNLQCHSARFKTAEL